jgi:hypothetical protein
MKIALSESQTQERETSVYFSYCLLLGGYSLGSARGLSFDNIDSTFVAETQLPRP